MLTWGRKFTETNARKERIRKESSGWVGRCLLPVVYAYQKFLNNSVPFLPDAFLILTASFLWSPLGCRHR